MWPHYHGSRWWIYHIQKRKKKAQVRQRILSIVINWPASPPDWPGPLQYIPDHCHPIQLPLSVITTRKLFSPDQCNLQHPIHSSPFFHEANGYVPSANTYPHNNWADAPHSHILKFIDRQLTLIMSGLNMIQQHRTKWFWIISLDFWIA